MTETGNLREYIRFIQGAVSSALTHALSCSSQSDVACRPLDRDGKECYPLLPESEREPNRFVLDLSRSEKAGHGLSIVAESVPLSVELALDFCKLEPTHALKEFA